ncbi:hypothetical protein FVF58_33670 [Paraburkholderia panacisoli]|uniref:Transposase n=1 Tax=Paraburkholderia panacisoli TaxID=2603818 RepID=A0A5B0GKS4_9BURK|nr:hypothetical protein FVF58_33670 [Paraburkholderia panacisoli]
MTSTSTSGATALIVVFSMCRFPEVSHVADLEEAFIDSTIVRAHQHATGAPKKTAIMRLVTCAAG